MEQQPNPLDPSHELPAGNDDDIMNGSLYEQIKAERDVQAETDRAAAEQQAIIDAARDEAERSPRLSQDERNLYRGIARAANVAELPEGVSPEDRRAATTLFSDRVTAEGNLNRLKQEAVERLRADKRDRRQEERDRKTREAREKAEQEAKEQQEREAIEAERRAEEAARQAKLDAEADRVRKTTREAYPEDKKQEIINEQVERDLSTKHAHLSEQSKNMMRQGLRERYAREAEAYIDDSVEETVKGRLSYIAANGGADAIESIRAKEIEQAEARRQQEVAAAAAAEEEAKRQAFLDRLHNRGGNREAIRETNEGDTPEPAQRTESPTDAFLANADADQLRAIVSSDVDSLPEGLDRDLRRTLLPVHAGGRQQANENLNALRARAQELLNEREDAAAGNSPDVVPNGDNGSQPDADAEREARERRFSDLYELEDQDRDEWRRQVNALSDEDRDAYFQYGLDRVRREAQQNPDWDSPTPVTPMPPVRRPRRRLFGGADPNAPLPTPANAGEAPVEPSTVAPENPNPLPDHTRTKWQAFKDWWPGRSRVSYQPHTRPSVIRGTGRLIQRGWNSLMTTPELSDEERAQAEGYISERDRRDEEEQRAPQPTPQPVTPNRPVVNRPARTGSRPRRPAPRSGYNALDDL